jgi:predicted PurR-regulated permease PerM
VFGWLERIAAKFWNTLTMGQQVWLSLGVSACFAVAPVVIYSWFHKWAFGRSLWQSIPEVAVAAGCIWLWWLFAKFLFEWCFEVLMENGKAFPWSQAKFQQIRKHRNDEARELYGDDQEATEEYISRPLGAHEVKDLANDITFQLLEALGFRRLKVVREKPYPKIPHKNEPPNYEI